MVKTPKTRHYRKGRPPATIDLAANPAEPGEPKADEKPQPGEFEPWVPEAADASPSSAAGTESDHTSGIDSSVEPVSAQTDDAGETALETGADDRSDTTQAVEDSHSAATDHPNDPTPPAPSSAQPPAQARSGLTTLTAGLAGGVAALILASVLQYAGVLGVPGGSGGDAGLRGQVEALRAEIGTLKSSDTGDTAGLVASLDQVKSDLADMQQAIQSGTGGDEAAVSALDTRLKQVEGQVTQLGQQQQGVSQESVDALAGKVATLEQSAAQLTSRVDAQGAQPKIALAISAAALKSALERGSSFTPELETFAAIAPNAPEIATLRQYAEVGVMSRTDIAKAFPEAANAMMAAAAPVDQNASFLQRLWSSAESVVKVRPVGEVPGEDPPARIARMEVAINAGDYDKALAEFAALPQNVQQAGAVLVDKVKARVAAEKLVDQMIAGAMKA